MSEYRFEPFSFKRFSDLKILFRSAFGANVDAEAIKRQYDTTAIGGEAISYVAISNETNEIAAHYAALPLQAIVNGQTVVTAQTSAAMTAENHRKKGLFKSLAGKVHEECRKRGMAFILSQPNSESYHAFLNVFRFTYADDIWRWDLKLKLKTAPLARFLVGSRFQNLYLNYCLALLRTVRISPPDDFTNSLATQDARILRNRSYLIYKQAKDKCFLQVDEAVLWIKLTDVLWIGDINDYNTVTEAVLRKLKRLAFLLGYNTISFHLNAKVPQPAFLKYFRKHNSEPSTVYYFDRNLETTNIILTGADFDTW